MLKMCWEELGDHQHLKCANMNSGGCVCNIHPVS